ncbi:MAG TPA: serine/threonine-protein kinase, partial [Steroidobacteraceae bacterium]|nr:serine/threonine-protein kinase [Steroidobacteraceae bacterium]
MIMLSAPPDDVASEICERLGATLGRPLGRGAAKHSYLASMPVYGTVALKILDPAFSAERLAREVEAMRRCNHEHIGRLFQFDHITIRGTVFPYLIEEFLSGGSLQDWTHQNGLLMPRSAQDVCRKISAAIAHLRDLNLVHRDIKPANILLRSGVDTPVLTDFGIVRDLSGSALTQSFVGQGPGTPLFAAPEQLRNEKALIDWRTDQFCLGVAISICAMGKHPYAQHGDTSVSCVSRVSQRQGPRTTFVEECEAVGLLALAKMVSPWPVHRFRS